MTNEEILQTLKALIGTTYEPSIKEVISQRTGRARVVGPKDITTCEFDPQRIQIAVDQANMIKEFRFG
ncbi:hypothetical protein G7009_20230 [Pseudomonas capeferrum]|uniref:I78 family peptidase inhibitor n=1 Tax=Pseudomonas capeferrum TaxID=1495066 RepID=UPI0015E31896|nr:I78 family peptidase inhibitor [Pseudomonas capeferrum]MBA1204052.1 hypothetical protein [Pseudomonas capeferrum]